MAHASQKSGGGVFDLLIHDVDYCLHAFGAPESVSAWGSACASGGKSWDVRSTRKRNLPLPLALRAWHCRVA